MGITLGCPQCAKKMTLLGEPWQTCKGCGYKFDPEDAKNELTKGYFVNKDNMYDLHEANCDECEGYETIVPVNDNWFCTQCFTLYDRTEIGQCSWCGGYSTGDHEDSFWRGCGFCDGKSGWDSDKDD